MGLLAGRSKNHARRDLSWPDDFVLPNFGGLHDFLRASSLRPLMKSEPIIMLIICAGLLVYLVYAMLRPEKF
jgi:K+-transporting ATPase KdpF subunit